MKHRLRTAPLTLLCLLAACGGDSETSPLERLTARSVAAPEEFAVLPQKPLEVPEDVTALPPPTPGQPSRVDLTPNSDAIAALNGRGQRGTVQASDNGLLASARAGIARPGIREELRLADREYRRDNPGRLLPRLFGQVNETTVYDGQSLNAEAELLRLRQAGIQVPAMPPAE